MTHTASPPSPQPNVQAEPFGAITYDLTGCEHFSRDVARIELIAAEGSNGPTEVIYLYAGQPPQNNVRWLPIDQADRTITEVQDFPEAGLTLRNSDRYWVRDEDGRTYEASWTDHKEGYWWDWEGEGPVDPVEFMPHPLDPRFAATATEGSEP